MPTETTPATTDPASPAPVPAGKGGIAGTPHEPAKSTPPRRWAPQPKKISRGLAITLIASATAMVLGLGFLTVKMLTPAPEAEVPRLDQEFTDPINSYSIRRPLGWRIEDPHDKSNIFLKGPKEPGYSPFIVSSLDVAPGSLASYLQLHKGRVEAQDKTVKWISEDLGESIDGCPHTARLEYEFTEETEQAGKVQVRALQYIMEDKPRFYRVSCYVAANLYEKYLPKFEASVRSFRRLPLPRALPGIH